MSFKVTNRLLKMLEVLYDHDAPENVSLVKNSNKKLEWKIMGSKVILEDRKFIFI